MTTGPKFNLLNIEDQSKPIAKLIEVVAAGIGNLYAPFGTVRQAKADARATIIRADADAEAASLAERAASRVAHREAHRQQNIEQIVSVAAQELPSSVSDKPVDPDWTLQYLDYAQDVSDHDMQTLWARILAGEVDKPGRYSKRTLSFLRTLEKEEAVWFTEFCSLALRDDRDWPIILRCDAYWEHYRTKFKSQDIEGHFTSIGLLLADNTTVNSSDLNGRIVSYFGKVYELVGPVVPRTSKVVLATNLEASFTLFRFTTIGAELASIAGASPIPDYVEHISESMPDFGVEFLPIDWSAPSDVSS